MDELNPQQVARFKRHVIVVAMCFAAVMGMKLYMDNQLSLKGAIDAAHDVANRDVDAGGGYEVEAGKAP